jgi:hypothetical protein
MKYGDGEGGECVERMLREEVHVGFLAGPGGKSYLEDLSVNGTIILKRILKKSLEDHTLD